MEKKRTILIVDDDAPHRFMLNVILGSWGYLTHKARNGPGAMTLIRRGCVDLVLMDIHLERESGIDVLRTLRSLDPHLPVILMTAYCPPEMARKADDLEAKGILMKPIRLDDLEAMIHRVLGPALKPSLQLGG